MAIQTMNDRAAASAKFAEKIAAAKRMLRLGKFAFEEIAEVSDLTIKEVESLASKESA